MCEIVWFRHDLRAVDQPALAAALRSGKNVIGLAVLDPVQWKVHGWGMPRMTWYIDSVHALSSELAVLGIPLRVEVGGVGRNQGAVVVDVARELNATRVHVGREAGFNERSRDRNVKTSLTELGIQFVEHTTETVLPVETIRSAAGKPYAVYTPFRNAWDEHLKTTGLCAYDVAGPELSPSSERPMPTLNLGQAPWRHSAWSAGTAVATQRLNAFLDGPVEHYHLMRDRPDVDGTSTLSPWLAVGALSPSMCLRPLVDQFGLDPEKWPDGPRVWRQELIWREFYRHVMMTCDRVSRGQPMQGWTRHVPWRSDADAFRVWKNGATGFDIIDAAMIQLRELGWMHNRLRMITAMFLTKNLLIDWRLGELHFAKHLIDYDFASNNGGWQWAASTGTDAAPYFRIFNPQSQAEKFDPDRQYQSQWLNGHARPAPIVDLKSTRAVAIRAFKSAKEQQRVR